MGEAEGTMPLHLKAEDWEELMAIVHALLRDRDVWAFGSRVTGRPKRFSDLDLALEGAEALSLTDLAELAEAFTNSGLPFRVDLVDLRTADPAFGARIRREGLRLQARGRDARAEGSTTDDNGVF